MTELCKNSSPTEVMTALELDAKIDKMKINVEVKGNGMTRVDNGMTKVSSHTLCTLSK